ncbi:hypothetical protein Tco_1449769 [Tanacetum coccineum]
MLFPLQILLTILRLHRTIPQPHRETLLLTLQMIKDLLASLAISPFHDDPYMKVMLAYNNATNDESHIPPPQTPIAPSTVLPPSSMFDPQDFFLHEKTLPPKKRARFLSSSSDFSTPPQVFEIGENYHGAPDTSYARHEEQIKTILNHLDELPLERMQP